MTSPSASQAVRAVLPDVAELREQFDAAGQAHVFRHFDDLSDRSRERLLDSARAIDLDVVQRLAEGRGLAEERPSPEPLGDALLRVDDLIADSARRSAASEEGRALLTGGKIACVTVAGGQGTRLGFGLPKGAFPIGPGSRTLFDIHARNIADASQEAGRAIPWVIVVSAATAPMTRVYLEEHGLPGVDRTAVRLAVQGSFPCLDDEGRLLLATRDRIAASPDGHGGALRALRMSGALAWLVNLGVEELSYFQVDNPLVPAADPLFLGLHRAANAQMSCKVFPKADSAERVGVLVRLDGRPGVIEYSELPAELASRTDDSGRLVYGAANMAAHALSLPFAAAMAFQGLPVHRVRKKVPYLGADGAIVKPDEPNAWKFETFIFDALPFAENSVVMEVERAREFAPVKNQSGPDSPDTARDMLRAAGKWNA